MSKSAGYIVKCKCGPNRCDEMNEFLHAAIYCSATIGYRTVVEREHYRGETFTRTVSYAINVDFRCWTCSRYFKVIEIRGRVKPEHKCDARCMASKGPLCECACGGKNHGRSWA